MSDQPPPRPSNSVPSRAATNPKPVPRSAASQAFTQVIKNQAVNPYPEENWVKTYWRPAMGWLYMLICLMDFVVFPGLTMVLPAMLRDFGVAITYVPWESLTLQAGGLVHIAFGAILGVAAWTRGNEKIARIKANS